MLPGLRATTNHPDWRNPVPVTAHHLGLVDAPTKAADAGGVGTGRRRLHDDTAHRQHRTGWCKAPSPWFLRSISLLARAC